MTHLYKSVLAAVAAAVYATSAITKDRTGGKTSLRSMHSALPASLCDKEVSFCSKPLFRAQEWANSVELHPAKSESSVKQMVWNESVLFYIGTVYLSFMGSNNPAESDFSKPGPQVRQSLFPCEFFFILFFAISTNQ